MKDGIQVVEELDSNTMRVYEIESITQEAQENGGYVTVTLSGSYNDVTIRDEYEDG